MNYFMQLQQDFYKILKYYFMAFDNYKLLFGFKTKSNSLDKEGYIIGR
jgi:hypothetical protein